MSAEGFIEKIEGASLVAAWTQLRNLVPEGLPHRGIRPAHWRWADMRRLLLQAGGLVPIELAERRVLGLHNPGYAGQRLATTSSIFIGMQLVLPGETAPDHRHTPAAARFVLEGSGAYTVVQGRKLVMEPGDLVLTPPHHSHAHANGGAEPVMWMDILDHPVAIPLETSYLVEGDRDAAAKGTPDAAQLMYEQAGLVPFRSPNTPPRDYPLFRYPWKGVREALLRAAGASDAGFVHLMYVNPETGGPVLKTLCFSALLLKAGATYAPPRRTASMVLHAIEGSGFAEIDGAEFAWRPGDVMAVPTHAHVRVQGDAKPAFLLQIDDGPMQHSLGYYEELRDQPHRNER